ncbi:MAG: 4,5-DOPA dioxygenase extradiol [Bacteroidetes bacterium]|nr:4,5-DOPA dioxygenase extradiol [Bacteroidota bacterium]
MTPTLKSFHKFSQDLAAEEFLMPMLFVGHGSPMNAIEDNEFSHRWKLMGKEIPMPKAVLIISAHWLTQGTHITAMSQPKTIHDFGGFPKELFDFEYPAPGNLQLAKETSLLVHSTLVGLDHDWGLDHGAWSIVCNMYPEANIPVLQLSIDYAQDAQYHYNLAKELASLRKKGVLIIGSGNMVHNLRMIEWSMMHGGGFDWALSLNEKFKTFILDGNHQALIHYEKLGNDARLAIPTPDHYLPLIYNLGLQHKEDRLSFFNDKAIGGSLTMTSVKFG